MKKGTKDEAAGKLREVTGAAKQRLGRAAGNPDMEARGAGEKAGGKIRKKVGQVEKVLNK
jgi:uncharacterized protein YjbJ (UPF0337 family)